MARNLVINWMKSRQRSVIIGGTDVWELLDDVPANAEAESVEFDRELRRVVFHRAADIVRGEVSENVWRAFWETSVNGATPGAAGETGDVGGSGACCQVPRDRAAA